MKPRSHLPLEAFMERYEKHLFDDAHHRTFVVVEEIDTLVEAPAV